MNKFSRRFFTLLVLFFFIAPVFAVNTLALGNSLDAVSKEKTAIVYLQKMQKAYTEKNYEILYVTSLQSEVEPMQLLHGVIDGEGLTYIRYLNGAIRESLQSSSQISYFEQGNQPYTLATNVDRSVFAKITHFNYKAGLNSYSYVVVGKGRIAGKRALVIHLISKDPYSYSYMIWLDLKSSLPLRLDTITNRNLLIEREEVVSLFVTEDVNPWLMKISQKRLPQLVHINKTKSKSLWKLNWLPPGFKIIKSDQHKLDSNDNKSVSYLMLSNGIVRVSVYISAIKSATGKEKIIQHGSTLIYTLKQGRREVTIIGEIPIQNAQRIVQAISREKPWHKKPV